MKNDYYKFFALPPETFFIPIVLSQLLFFALRRNFLGWACVVPCIVATLLLIASAADLFVPGKKRYFLVKVLALLASYLPMLVFIFMSAWRS